MHHHTPSSVELHNIYCLQNTVYFIITYFPFEIILTFSIKHVLKFKYLPSCNEDQHFCPLFGDYYLSLFLRYVSFYSSVTAWQRWVVYWQHNRCSIHTQRYEFWSTYINNIYNIYYILYIKYFNLIIYIYIYIYIYHLQQECHNSKFGIFELLVLKETFAVQLLTGIVS